MRINIQNIQAYFERAFQVFLAQHSLLSVPILSKAITYSALAGGKRFRPSLVYLVAHSIDKNFKNTQADCCAFAIEMLHIYSLIHDDLPAMDDDDFRHHKPSCHIAHSEAMAILAGDGLQSLAFDSIVNDESLSLAQRIAMIKVVSKHGFNMVNGQALDLDANNHLVDLDYLKQMHSHKTGALLRCSIALGVIVSGNQCYLDKFDVFASHLGLAYQIQDDVLDVVSSKELLGKQQGSDEINQKTTYVNLLGLQGATQLFNQHYDKAILALNELDIEVQPLMDLTKHLKVRKF